MSNFHFAEIEKLKADQQRELKINLNGKRYLTESVKLDYLKPQTIVQNDPPVSGERIYFQYLQLRELHFLQSSMLLRFLC